MWQNGMGIFLHGDILAVRRVPVVFPVNKFLTKEPTWNEEFALNIKQPPVKDLQVAAWDANLVTPHKRMGNAAVNLESLCDGNMHELLVELQGMGGGGKLQIEIKYKSFDKIEEEKKWWRIPIITELLEKNGFESALKTILGSETVQARQFVQFAFAQLKLINDANIQKDQTSNETEGIKPDHYDESGTQVVEATQSDKQFWKNIANTVNLNVVQRLGLPAFEKIRWDGFELLNKIGLQSQQVAEAGYIESGLATPEKKETLNGDASPVPPVINTIQSSLPDIKKVTEDLLRQTDSILGALMVLNATVSKLNKGIGLIGSDDTKNDSSTEMKNDVHGYPMHKDALILDEKKAEEMRELFTTAETAMEAWAMLATSLGHSTFIKSEFDKICFLDNSSTDTQASSYVALWWDSLRKRLVVAFRGTEQDRWKDLRTDLMLVPAG
nr:C2 calcium-dependent membrane targeting [Ipomoea batatas]